MGYSLKQNETVLCKREMNKYLLLCFIINHKIKIYKLCDFKKKTM